MPPLPYVLIIDHQALVADAARRALERQSLAHCAVAATRDEAIAAMRTSMPDLVVLNFELDDKHCVLDFIAELRETWHLPVVVFSSRSDARYWQIISRVRPEAVLSKPVGPAKLAAAVRKVLDIDNIRMRSAKQYGDNFPARGLIDSMVEVVVATDLGGRVTMVNHGGMIVGGALVDSLIGKPVDDVLGLVDREGHPIALAESARCAADVLRWSACEGRLGEIWIPGELEVLLAPMPGTKGGIAGMLVVISPTETWYAERATTAIDTNEKDWQNVLQSIGRGVMVANHEGKIIYANAIAARLLGANVELPLDASLNELLPENQWQRMGDPETRDSLEIIRLRNCNSLRVIELAASPFGEGSILFPSDVTRMIEESEQRIRETRLSDLGSIARGLAHELNNQLTVVGGALESVDILSFDPAERELMQSARNAAKRAADVVQQMEIFAKPEPKRNELFEWCEVIAALEKRFSGILKINDVIPAIWLKGDREQLTLALNKLIENGVQAMRGRDPSEITMSSRLAENGRLQVKIRDNGCGIATENLAKVVDPYFSTRHGENAMGLGLTVADRMISAHRGTLAIHSEPGAFTEVSITLPTETPPRQADVRVDGNTNAAPADLTGNEESRRGRILILDDEPAVGSVLSIALKRDGWDVDIALEGAEAVSKWRAAYESGSSYALMISDLTIPGGMGGKEAVEHIHRFDPDAAALASSGYSDDPVMERPQEFGFLDAVAKPYELQHMLATVRRCARFD